MCLLAVAFQVIDDCPLIVAANREESYGRQGTLPEIWDAEPAFLAGRDPQAGGTWLGVNRHGLLAAITNRPRDRVPPAVRSRGLLCRDLLGCLSASQAFARACEAMERDPYAGFNLLVADAVSGHVLHAGNRSGSCDLRPGMHVLTAGDLDDESDARIARAQALLTRAAPRTVNEWLDSLVSLCRDHGAGGTAPICLHGHDRGTVSSAAIALTNEPTAAQWWHAQGPPCQSGLVDCSPPLRTLLLGKAPSPKWQTPNNPQ